MEAEAEMQMDEIMSLMSEDMECFDEQPSGSQEKKAQPLVQSIAEQKRSSDTAEASSSSKRQRVDNEALGSHQKPKVSLEKGSGSSKDQRQTSKQPIISIKIEPSDYTTAVPGSRKPSERSRVSTSNNMQPFEDVGFIKVRCKHFISSYSHHVKKMNCLTLVFYMQMFHNYLSLSFILFLQDSEPLKVDVCQPKDEPKTPLKPVVIKQESHVSP